MYEIKDTKTGEIQFIDADLLEYLRRRAATQEELQKLTLRNQNFTQFDNQKLRNELPRLAISNKYAMSVFLLLSSLAGTNNGVVCSQAEISEISGLLKSRVSEGISYLIQQEMIKVHRLRGGGSLFALNEEIVWKTKRSKKTLSLFRSANVVLSNDAKKVTRSIAIAINDISGKQGRPPTKAAVQKSKRDDHFSGVA